MNGDAIREYANSLGRKTNQFLDEVSDKGLNQVANKDGYTVGGEIIVNVEKRDNARSLKAIGRGVLMVEFGAGSTVSTNHPYASTFGNIGKGTYSSSIGTGEYARTGKWHWRGLIFTGIRPRHGMLHASTEMKRSIPRIAKRVFSAK